MAQKKIPARQCIGCMTSRPKKELVRVVRAPSGEISIDPVGKSPAAARTSARTPPALQRQKRKRRWSAALSSRFPPKFTTRWPGSWPR